MAEVIRADGGAVSMAEGRGHHSDVQSSRAVQEVQAAMAIAKRFPRETTVIRHRVLDACRRLKLAEAAMYGYQRGGVLVEGPSIRLAEEIARSYGNIDFGVTELEQGAGYSVVMAYCVDLETNTRQVKTFTVEHVRYTRADGRKKLTDPRDIYEVVANQAARRLRACILGVVPSDLQEEAVEQCRKTLAEGAASPEQIAKLVVAFQAMSVTKEQLEDLLGHSLESISGPEVVRLRTIYTSIKDGFSAIEDHFERERKNERPTIAVPQAEKPANPDPPLNPEESVAVGPPSMTATPSELDGKQTRTLPLEAAFGNTTYESVPSEHADAMEPPADPMASDIREPQQISQDEIREEVLRLWREDPDWSPAKISQQMMDLHGIEVSGRSVGAYIRVAKQAGEQAGEQPESQPEPEPEQSSEMKLVDDPEPAVSMFETLKNRLVGGQDPDEVNQDMIAAVRDGGITTAEFKELNDLIAEIEEGGVL